MFEEPTPAFAFRSWPAGPLEFRWPAPWSERSRKLTKLWYFLAHGQLAWSRMDSTGRTRQGLFLIYTYIYISYSNFHLNISICSRFAFSTKLLSRIVWSRQRLGWLLVSAACSRNALKVTAAPSFTHLSPRIILLF